jgi:orotate phosphoribosyltransferase
VEEYQRQFLELAVTSEALRFGQFTLKSGRVSPYFFNAGAFNTGARLGRLAQYYARTIIMSGLEFDMLYGPAYKGIPLATATSIALYGELGHDIPYAFNRKEVKDHGEGGRIVGSPLTGRVLIVDDVISAGTSVRESVEIIGATGAIPTSVIIALDRQERGSGSTSTVREVERDFGLRVISVVCLEDIVQFLESKSETEAALQRIRQYRERYGVVHRAA